MKERPTPETDAEHAKFAMGGFTLDFCRKLEQERDEAREAVRLASIEAKALATSIQKSEYSDVKFELCDSVAGVISQIDNMYAGVREQRDEARNKMADALQEVDLRNLDFERMKQERDEARAERDILRLNSLGTIQLNIPVTTDWKEETK